MTKAFQGGYYAEFEDVYHTEEQCPAGRLIPPGAADGEHVDRPLLVPVLPGQGGGPDCQAPVLRGRLIDSY